MGPGNEASGGSAGNTIAGIAALGGKTAYIGKVADDQLGDVFTHDIRAVGVTYDTHAARRRAAHGAQSLIFVTPDAQRTMQTFLGATTQLGPEDVNMDYITGSKVLYLEGYLWDQPRAKEAMRNAAIKATRPASRCRSRCPTRSASRGSATSSSSWPRSTSTSCSRTRARSCRSTRSRTSTTRCSRCAATARSRR